MRLSTKTLLAQLRQRIVQDSAIAARAGLDAKDAAQNSATVAEKRQDARTMIEFGNLAHAQTKRVQQAQAQVRTLDGFQQRPLPRYSDHTPIGLGAIVEAMTEDDTGMFSRTFVMLPVGAGEELAGPGGDGIVTVLTPSSPVGKAMLGKTAGDVAETTLRGEPIEWEILEVSC